MILDIIAIVFIVIAVAVKICEFIFGERKKKETVETNIFDKEETFTDCTVQVLTNTVTGETSVGWWHNDNPPMGVDDADIH